MPDDDGCFLGAPHDTHSVALGLAALRPLHSVHNDVNMVFGCLSFTFPAGHDDLAEPVHVCPPIQALHFVWPCES